MKITPIAIALLAASSANAASPAKPTAQTIYLGGDIVTVNDAAPTAQALAIKDGRILALGSEADILTLRDGETRVVNLQGKTLIPGFIDAHGHVFNTGIQAFSANLLAPPDGGSKQHCGPATIAAKLGRQAAKQGARDHSGFRL